jgi:hypothetical protein
MFSTFLCLSLATPGQLPPPPHDMLVGQLADLERRVAALESRAGILPIHAPAARHDTYAEARARAIRENLPLVAWSGSAICPPCVASTEGEFVNWVGTHPDLTPNALTVAVPEDGDLWNVATVTTWQTGHAEFGHVPSIRRVLANWRDRRQVTRMATTASMMTAPTMANLIRSYQPPQFGTMPMMGYGQPMMMGSGGGGSCASCGSSGGRGFFRR